MDNDLIDKYKLQRKNIYSGYIVCGLCVLGGVTILSSGINLYNGISCNEILKIIGEESLVIGGVSLLIPTLKTIPINIKIHKLKLKKRK